MTARTAPPTLGELAHDHELLRLLTLHIARELAQRVDHRMLLSRAERARAERLPVVVLVVDELHPMHGRVMAADHRRVVIVVPGRGAVHVPLATILHIDVGHADERTPTTNKEQNNV